jgi:hypothetical protein
MFPTNRIYLESHSQNVRKCLEGFPDEFFHENKYTHKWYLGLSFHKKVLFIWVVIEALIIVQQIFQILFSSFL